MASNGSSTSSGVSFDGAVYSPFLTCRLPTWAGVRQNVIGSTIDGSPVLPTNASSMRYETVSATGGQATLPISSFGTRVLPADPAARFSTIQTPAAAYAAAAAARNADFEERIVAGLTDLAEKINLLNVRQEMDERALDTVGADIVQLKQGLEFFAQRVEALTGAVTQLQEQVQQLQEAASAAAVVIPATPASPQPVVPPAAAAEVVPLPVTPPDSPHAAAPTAPQPAETPVAAPLTSPASPAPALNPAV
ncbi:IX [Titi monkey adenovirus ECC-2011]|uniref:IX n=1 Tax=titi monkey adenovirus 1 TaxID=3123084 RepID=G0ZAH4_9ADEN|nr:IX [Titi monkey adenovirus ECC-2011]AEK98445.1 IX [Titi monkey adenovirus ECC-2011]